jgi:alkaline phosphatase D
MKSLSRTALIALTSAACAQENTAPLTRIAYGSCCHEGKPAPIFASVSAYKPQLFIWLGDNIYGDSRDTAVLREKYKFQASRKEYIELSKNTAIIGVWDDHDYGENDAGNKYPNRVEAQQALLDFLKEPADTTRRKQEGIYTTYTYGSADKQVRFILLDARYFRDDIGSDGTILGDAQWAWLEKTLKESKAQIHVVISSYQVLAEEHRFEKWSNFPRERKKLFALLAQPDVPPVLFLSGDRHLAEISQVPADVVGYPLIEVTSSALNRSGGGVSKEINRHRVGENFTLNNFGTLTIDWSRSPALITASIHNEEGAPVRALTFPAPQKKK